MKTSFDDEWDVMPNGRHKAIHSVGAVCPFKIDVAHDSPYTGLLKVFFIFLTFFFWAQIDLCLLEKVQTFARLMSCKRLIVES